MAACGVTQHGNFGGRNILEWGEDRAEDQLGVRHTLRPAASQAQGMDVFMECDYCRIIFGPLMGPASASVNVVKSTSNLHVFLA